MTRYFQHTGKCVGDGCYTGDGSVFVARDEFQYEAISHRIGTDYTEVQVVPLDAIVIRRDELPEVHTFFDADGDTVWEYEGDAFDRDADNRTADAIRDEVLRLLSRAEHLREHPPIDEAQVEALTALIDETYPGVNLGLARRLVENGVRVGGDSDV